mgnify:FL=1
MRYKKIKTLKDLQQDPRVIGVDKEYDDVEECYMYWCYLKPGFRTEDNDQHTISEPTLKDVCSEVNNCREWKDDPSL